MLTQEVPLWPSSHGSSLIEVGEQHIEVCACVGVLPMCVSIRESDLHMRFPFAAGGNVVRQIKSSLKSVIEHIYTPESQNE